MHPRLVNLGHPASNDPLLAAELAPFVVAWLAEDSGTFKDAIGGGTFVSNWGGNGVTSTSAGVTGDKCLMNEVSRLLTTDFLSGYAQGDSIFYAILFHVDSSVADNINLGLGRNTSAGVERNPFNCFQLNASGGAGTIQLRIFDYGPPQVYVTSTPHALTDGLHQALAAYNPATKTWHLYLDNAGEVGSVVLLAHPPAESVNWMVVEDNPGKSAFTALPQAQIEQWPVFYDATGAFVPDATHCAYLWNHGNGKTRAQFLADAA